MVALSFKANAFEVREMGVLMLYLDLKGCKLCGRALLSFGLIWILSAPRDLKRWSLRGTLIDDKLEVNSTLWNVDQHHVKMRTSYGFSRHTKVVDITTLVQYSLVSWKLETHCAMNMKSKTFKYLLNCHRSSTTMT